METFFISPLRARMSKSNNFIREKLRKEAKNYNQKIKSDNFREKSNISNAMLKDNNFLRPYFFCILGAPKLFSFTIVW